MSIMRGNLNTIGMGMGGKTIGLNIAITHGVAAKISDPIGEDPPETLRNPLKVRAPPDPPLKGMAEKARKVKRGQNIQ